MARQLFGTDGIRGVAGQYPLDRRTVFAVGKALGHWAIGIHGTGSEILIGMDTRESGPVLASCLAAGLETAGAVPRFAGLITTPGVAYLTRSRDFVAGVMISASHNPYQDNGIKVFDHSGFKLPDEQEHKLEGEIFALLEQDLVPKEAALAVDPGLDDEYASYLKGTFPHRLDGMLLVLDCANGAATHIAPKLFRNLGADVVTIGCNPDGLNINLNCGALHVEQLRRKVIETSAAIGLAFDGDADRAMIVSAGGRLIDGDAVLLLTADSLLRRDRLRDGSGENTVVATVMSNFGLQAAFDKRGVRMLRAPVGDKYVLEEMIRLDARIGGEQSGHVIFRDYATTGDGILTALRVLEVMKETGKGLDELAADFKSYPQLLVNVRVQEKRPLEQLPGVQAEIASAIAAFNGSGRVLVRYSGTESLARVMVEGPDDESVSKHAHRIAKAVQAELGAA